MRVLQIAHHGVGFHLAEGMLQNRTVGEIALIKIRSGINRFGMALGKVVKNRNLEPPVDEFLNANAADVTGSARHEYFFHFQL